MSSNNKAPAPQEPVHPSFFAQLQPHSLRLRLVLWYGTLLTTTLGLFVLLVLSLTMNTLTQSVDSALRAEARAAAVEIDRELVSIPPYWPPHLSLNTLNAYRDPGVVIEVVDMQGNQLYDSDANPATRIPIKPEVTRATLAGRPFEYNDRFAGEPVLIEAVPIYAPERASNGDVLGPAGNGSTPPAAASTTAAHPGPVIGTLLVAKSLQDVQATLALVQTLLLLTGGVTLVGALLGGWVIAGHVLHPLAEMAKTARTIAATTARGTRIGNLSPRVRRPRGHDEMAQVVDALNEMLSDLEKATQGQRRFVADASHELRAPLTTIQGNLAFLRRHGDELQPQERRVMLDDAHGETLRLTRLVEELLLLARADAHIDSPPTSSEQMVEENRQQLVELDRVTLQLVRQLRGRLQGEDAAPRLEIGHIEPVRVHTDEESLRRIMLILLDNALKYTPPSTEPGKGRVLVSVEQKEQEAVLHISDTGTGIEAAELPHIFERFYRADRTRSRQGTGLGLAIAKTLVEQLGGRITAESTPGQGSTFSIWLPLA